MKHESFTIDQLAPGETRAPKEIYDKVLQAYADKCGQTSRALIAFSVLGGAMICLGALFYLQVLSGDPGGSGVIRVAAGAAFSLGLVMIIITGAELFTGNVMAVLSVAHRMTGLAALARNWALAYACNFAGALLLGGLVAMSGLLGSEMGQVLDKVVAAKTALPPGEAFARAILCNLLVCLAIWMSLSTVNVMGRIACIVGPITAFVALGMEHSVANMAFFAMQCLSEAALPDGAMAWNLVVVTLGNVVGAVCLCVAMSLGFAGSRGS